MGFLAPKWTMACTAALHRTPPPPRQIHHKVNPKSCDDL